MTVITKEYLENQIESLNSQRNEHIAAAQAAEGAIKMAQHLLTVLNDKEATENVERIQTIKDFSNSTGLTVEGIEEL